MLTKILENKCSESSTFHAFVFHRVFKTVVLELHDCSIIAFAYSIREYRSFDTVDDIAQNKFGGVSASHPC